MCSFLLKNEKKIYVFLFNPSNLLDLRGIGFFLRKKKQIFIMETKAIVHKLDIKLKVEL